MHVSVSKRLNHLKLYSESGPEGIFWGVYCGQITHGTEGRYEILPRI